MSVDLRDRIVSRHRSGEGYENIYAALKLPKDAMASIILKWKTFVTPKILLRAGRLVKQQLGEKGLGQGGDKPDGHADRAPEFLCGDGRTFQNYN